MADEIEESLRRNLGRGTRLTLYVTVLLLGLVHTWLRWSGRLDIERGLLFGPVLMLMAGILLVRELRRR